MPFMTSTYITRNVPATSREHRGDDVELDVELAPDEAASGGDPERIAVDPRARPAAHAARHAAHLVERELHQGRHPVHRERPGEDPTAGPAGCAGRAGAQAGSGERDRRVPGDV